VKKHVFVIFEPGFERKSEGGAFLSTINIINAISADMKVTLLSPLYLIESAQLIIKRQCDFIELPARPINAESFIHSLYFDIKLYFKFFREINSQKLIISSAKNNSFILFCLIKHIRVFHSVATSDRRIFSYVKTFFYNSFFTKAKYVSVSNYHRDNLISCYKLDPSRVSVLYNKAFFSPQSNPVTKIGEERSQKVHILTVGHVTKYKNPMLWLDVAKAILEKNKNVEFTWVGDGEMFPVMEAEVCALEGINFIGHSNALDFWYEKADILFHPSKIETHGMVVVEAMSYSLPSVVSSVGGLKESVKHVESGFLVNSNCRVDFIRYLDKLINDKQLRVQLGSEALNLFNQKYSSSKYTIQVNRILNIECNESLI
jgi:glycosyltransferase involved in cell wall biosynthesis